MESSKVEITMINGQTYTVVLKGENIDDIEKEYDRLMEKNGFQTIETESEKVVSINKDYIVTIAIVSKAES